MARASRNFTTLLRQPVITRPTHVWAADITYLPMQRGFVLRAILGWASRRVLNWLSNTLTTGCCLDAVRETASRYGRPKIFNTNQGCQFISQEFTQDFAPI